MREGNEKTRQPREASPCSRGGKGLPHNQEGLFYLKCLVDSRKKLVPMNLLPQTSINTAYTLEGDYLLVIPLDPGGQLQQGRPTTCFVPPSRIVVTFFLMVT